MKHQLILVDISTKSFLIGEWEGVVLPDGHHTFSAELFSMRICYEQYLQVRNLDELKMKLKTFEEKLCQMDAFMSIC